MLLEVDTVDKQKWVFGSNNTLQTFPQNKSPSLFVMAPEIWSGWKEWKEKKKKEGDRRGLGKSRNIKWEGVVPKTLSPPYAAKG